MAEPRNEITPEMIEAIAKTFAIAHADDTDLHLAQALAYNTGRLAWRIRELGLTVDQKTSVSDVVTQADTMAEAFISRVLELLRPEDGLVGEEGTHTPSRSGRTWVIDPVDGTYNFVSGSDYWCSALALITGQPENPQTVQVGAVHRPAMGYTWVGGDLTPTLLEGAPVPGIVDEDPAEVSLVSYAHPRWINDDTILSVWRAVSSQFATIRMLGAGSVDLAGVAAGNWGMWMQHSVAPWDWLPGKALVEAAGGSTARVVAGGVEWFLAGSARVVETSVAALQAAR
ncbi:MAG: inositol monophosphatase family protein [Corynebacterium sp.]|nr:inositol monophosphatase family protein [Corynebacterium sp.]